MATNPNNEHEAQINDRQLEGVSGGRTPIPKVGKNLEATELSDEDLQGVSGGGDTASSTDSVVPPGWREPQAGKDHKASEL